MSTNLDNIKLMIAPNTIARMDNTKPAVPIPDLQPLFTARLENTNPIIPQIRPITLNEMTFPTTPSTRLDIAYLFPNLSLPTIITSSRSFNKLCLLSKIQDKSDMPIIIRDLDDDAAPVLMVERLSYLKHEEHCCRNYRKIRRNGSEWISHYCIGRSNNLQ